MSEELGAPKVLFVDNFSKPLDTSVWKLPLWTDNKTAPNSSYIADTQFYAAQDKVYPTVKGGYLRLKLDTWLNGDNKNFHGTDVFTKEKFGIKDGGIAFEVKGRYDSKMEPGMVAGLFLYSTLKEEKKGPEDWDTWRDEIDWELLSKQASQAGTNVFANEKTGGAGHFELPDLPGGVQTEHVFRIEWTKKSVTWKIDGQPVRVVTDPKLIPQNPMNIHLNLWAPGDYWADAYFRGPNFRPAATIGEGKQYYYLVDQVKVERLSELNGDNKKGELVGSEHDNWIYGKAGDDKLLGKTGDDTLFGGKGGDALKQGNRFRLMAWLVG